MFVHHLDPKQQAALLHYAHAIVKADGAVEDEESEYLDLLKAQTTPGVDAENVPLEEIGALFGDRRSRVAMLLELIGMGYVDESFDAEEAVVVGQVSRALDFSDEDVLDFTSWVRRQMMLMAEAEQLMEG